jgi:hypothetical protein
MQVSRIVLGVLLFVALANAQWSTPDPLCAFVKCAKPICAINQHIGNVAGKCCGECIANAACPGDIQCSLPRCSVEYHPESTGDCPGCADCVQDFNGATPLSHAPILLIIIATLIVF